MRRRAPILLLAVAAQSCTSQDLPAPAISSVDPGAVPNASSTGLTVLGANFLAEVAAVSEELRESLRSLRTGGLSLSAGYQLRP